MTEPIRPRRATPEEMIESLRRAAADTLKLDEDTPLGRATREFFTNNWAACRDGLLTKTRKIRVYPEPSSAPRSFRFEMDVPYKYKHGDGPVMLAPGPVRGVINYHPQLLEISDPKSLSIAVTLDSDLGFFHPNYSRQFGLVCLGDLPAGPFPLDALLEHLYSILSFANWRAFHPADVEAARHFALEPTALAGVGNPEPLY
jgi:hypothetical protein